MTTHSARSSRQLRRLCAAVSTGARRAMERAARIGAATTGTDTTGTDTTGTDSTGAPRDGDVDLRLATAELLWQVDEVVRWLGQPATSRPMGLDRYLDALEDAEPSQDPRTLARAGQGSAAELAEELVRTLGELVLALDADVPAVVHTDRGLLATADLLRLAALRVVVYLDRLARVAGEDEGPGARTPAAEAEAVRLLAAVLAMRAPGQAIEVRVPPHAAVQIGDPAGSAAARRSPGTGHHLGPAAPTHTRGTPPAVVETDPVTFLRLGTGHLSWDAAVDGHRVQASGLRTDLSPLLPLVR